MIEVIRVIKYVLKGDIGNFHRVHLIEIIGIVTREEKGCELTGMLSAFDTGRGGFYSDIEAFFDLYHTVIYRIIESIACGFFRYKAICDLLLFKYYIKFCAIEVDIAKSVIEQCSLLHYIEVFGVGDLCGLIIDRR